MPTGPNCDMSWDECITWARNQDGIDDPESYCGARERDCKAKQMDTISTIMPLERGSIMTETPQQRIVHKLARVETKALGPNRIHAIVSSEERDRDGDVIRVGGWELGYFTKHPILIASHDYFNLRAQIGEWEDISPKGKTLEGVARYYVGEGNEQADWGFNLASKNRAAYSVGFIPEWGKAKELKEGGVEFNGQELIEVSHVTVPSNRSALQDLKSKTLHPIITSIIDETLEDIPDSATAISQPIDEIVELVLERLHSISLKEKPSVPSIDIGNMIREAFRRI
jgi:hypothetical protein